MRVLWNILICFCGALCFSCAGSVLTSSDNLFMRLKDRGPVALSSDNPYLAANLLIAREMDASPEIRGFVEHRGAPAALEVQSNLFSPSMIHFYYPENREQYTLEDVDGMWIIKGPVMIEREKMKEVAQLTRNIQGEPKIAYAQESKPSELRASTRPPYEPPKTESSASKKKEPSSSELFSDTSEEDPFIAKLNASDSSRAKMSNKPFSSPSFSSEESVGKSRPIRVNSEQEDSLFIQDLVAEFGSHPAELSPKGDVVHYITYPGENMSIIARWYTYDRNNAQKIARINRLRQPDSLSIGDEIVIPAYLVKNKNRLTEEAMKAMMLKN